MFSLLDQFFQDTDATGIGRHVTSVGANRFRRILSARKVPFERSVRREVHEISNCPV